MTMPMARCRCYGHRRLVQPLELRLSCNVATVKQDPGLARQEGFYEAGGT